jgi:hypothetical protein
MEYLLRGVDQDWKACYTSDILLNKEIPTMKTFTGAEHEAMEAIGRIADGMTEISNEISSLDLNPKDQYDGMTTPDHLYNISFYLSELVDTMKKIEAKLK